MIKIIIAAFAALALAGCSTTQPGDFCLVSAPIRPSASDQLTEGTVRQVLAHNLYGERTCAWRP